MATKGQIPLPLASTAEQSHDTILRFDSNALAVELLFEAERWFNGTAVIVGPAASGKTHMLTAVANDVSVMPLTPETLYASYSKSVLVIDDLHRIAGNIHAQELLFHLINRSIGGELKILMGSLKPTRSLDVELPDLASRLNAASSAVIAPPEDELLLQLLTKRFSDHQVEVKPTVTEFCAQRIDRSYAAVARTVAILNSLALAEGRAITIPLAKEALGI